MTATIGRQTPVEIPPSGRDADPAFFLVAHRTQESGPGLSWAIRDARDPADGASLALALFASGFDDLTILGTKGGLDAVKNRLARRLSTDPAPAVRYLGLPFDDAATSAAIAAALRAQTPSSTDLLAGAVERVFEGDLVRLGRFVACLRPALPAGTRLLLRGSAVVGRSFRTGVPFDAAGPYSSDLDVVVTGSEAMGLWSPDGFYLAGINSRPLCDQARWVAPELDQARTSAQDIARRPVAIQAMADWFLELRGLVQGQPHVALDDLAA